MLWKLTTHKTKEKKIQKFQNENNTNSIIWQKAINIDINNKKCLKGFFYINIEKHANKTTRVKREHKQDFKIYW